MPKRLFSNPKLYFCIYPKLTYIHKHANIYGFVVDYNFTEFHYFNKTYITNTQNYEQTKILVMSMN